jgi:hypothetical protein
VACFMFASVVSLRRINIVIDVVCQCVRCRCCKCGESGTGLRLSRLAVSAAALGWETAQQAHCAHALLRAHHYPAARQGLCCCSPGVARPKAACGHGSAGLRADAVAGDEERRQQHATRCGDRDGWVWKGRVPGI